MESSVPSHAEKDTAKIAQDLAKRLPEQEIIFLNGDLGAGKTVFARALIRALCDAPNMEVISPTFTLVQSYETPKTTIHHYDLYRIEDPEEIFELGWEDSMASGITIIEWPERLGPYTPASYLDITITNVENEKDHRTITIHPHCPK